MKKVFLFLILLCFSISFAQKEKQITISPFFGVNVYSGIHVKLIPSEENKMIISGDNIETVVFTLKKDVLKIRHSINQLLNPSNTYIELYFTEKLDAIHGYHIYGPRARSLGSGMKLRPTHVMQWPKLG